MHMLMLLYLLEMTPQILHCFNLFQVLDGKMTVHCLSKGSFVMMVLFLSANKPIFGYSDCLQY